MAARTSKRIALVTRAKLLRQIPAVVEELGTTDRGRLQNVLWLLGDDGRARLSECLKSAYPGKAVDDALKAFKVFRAAVNKAADTAHVPLLFTVDTSKKTPPAGP